MNTQSKPLWGLLAAIALQGSAHAEASMLRVSCEGSDVGAEVSINGAFKGECPLDIQVEAGFIKLQAFKKADAFSERVFEQEFRIGEGVVKKIAFTLPPARLNAAGQLREEARLRQEAQRRAQQAENEHWRQAERAQDSASLQGYLDSYPAGAHASEASVKLVSIRTRAQQAAATPYARGAIGVQLANVDDRSVKLLGLTDTHGVLVHALVPGAAAQQAGVLANDVILGFNGQAFDRLTDLTRAVRGTPVGSKANLQLRRRGIPTEVQLTIGELTDEMLMTEKTRQEIKQTRGMFPQDTGGKQVTLTVLGNVLNEAGQEVQMASMPHSYGLRIYNKAGICNWELDTVRIDLYFGAGILPAGSLPDALGADLDTLRSKQDFAGSLASMAAGQTLLVSSRTGQTRITAMETKASWPEFNFPYAGTRLAITKDYEPSAYYDREQVAIYSPEVGCAIPMGQTVVRNTGNRLFGDKTRFSEKTLSAVMTDK